MKVEVDELKLKLPVSTEGNVHNIATEFEPIVPPEFVSPRDPEA